MKDGEREQPIENYGKKEQKEWLDNILPDPHPCTAGNKEEEHTALVSSCYTQTKKRRLNQFAMRTGLRINKKKTQVLRINSKCKNRILIDDQELKELDKYIYLGFNVSKQGEGSDDIVNITARVSFIKLKQIWNSNIYTLRSKLILLAHLCCCVEVKHGK